MGLTCALSIDGVMFSVIGIATEFTNGNHRLEQVTKVVLPTSTHYQFHESASNIELFVTFTQVVDQLNSESETAKPYSYVSLSLKNNGNDKHAVRMYFDILADWVLDAGKDAGQSVIWADETSVDPANWVMNTIRNYDNVPFSEKGDAIKMNW
jgi:hypothetical protein